MRKGIRRALAFMLAITIFTLSFQDISHEVIAWAASEAGKVVKEECVSQESVGEKTPVVEESDEESDETDSDKAEPTLENVETDNSEGNNKEKLINKFTNNKSPITNNSNLISKKDDLLQLKIGFDFNTKQNLYIPESGLYQNFLITGTIGSGKTSSAMYPFTEQIMKYNSKNPSNKIGTLILDVKGNYFSQVLK